MSKIVCPNCGESYYTEKYSTRTAVYYPAVWKDGVNQNPDGNVTTTYCECINCHYSFSYKEQYGKIIEVTLGEKLTPVPTIAQALNNFSQGNTIVDVAFTHLPTNIVYTQENARETEIKRLEQQIESLKDQLAEVKANPEWQQQIHI